MPVSRFAPSPTGKLHLGHAYSAWRAWDLAGGSRFWLRMEDIDQGRCREEFVAGIFEDLAWLGIEWEPEVWFQSSRSAAYREALSDLRDAGVLYPCFCSRREIMEELARIGSAPHGTEAVIYPGTCRGLGRSEREDRLARGDDHCWRLDMAEAVRRTGALGWVERGVGSGSADAECFGDVVLGQRENGLSYFLCCVVDDAAQEVELVTRGRDLHDTTAVQVVLQRLLGFRTPEYFHHPLVVDSEGRRLAKRFDSLSISALRGQGLSAPEVRALAERSLE